MLGCLFLWPGIITLTRFIGEQHPVLAVRAGMFTILGLIGRVFHGGIDIALVPPGRPRAARRPPPSRRAVLWTIACIAFQVGFIVLSIILPEIMRH